MTKVKWLVDSKIEYDKSLFEALKRKRCPVKASHYYNVIEKGCDKYYAPDDCVVCYGSIMFINYIQRKSSWVPGTFGQFDNYKVSEFTNYIDKDYFVNGQYVMLPLHALDYNKDMLFDVFGSGDCIFVKPDEGKKAIIATTIHKIQWGLITKKDWTNVSPNEILVVSRACNGKPYSIEKEWRFFVSGTEIVTGSLYHKDGMLEFKDDSEEDRKEAERYAGKIAVMIHKNKEDMDKIYVLDVGKISNGEYKVMELNAASCSGFYDCDVDAYVDKVNELAIAEYDDINGKG